MPVRVVEPMTNAERWVSLYMEGSRGFSHEMVRHRFAISQRSTRYCGEETTKWEWHPIIWRYIQMQDDPGVVTDKLRAAQDAGREAYEATVKHLEGWLLQNVLDKDVPYRRKHARKQARGAARGFLGNALETRMVFSAPVWAWRHIVKMRAADAADAEIRQVVTEALRVLRTSRYAPEFADLVLGPASDGMGMSLVDGGHA